MGEELDISDVNGICRLCLKDDCTIIPIFGRENTSRNGVPLSKKILDCVSVKVSDGDGLPSMICVGCVHQVDSWQGFKNNCDQSQKKLNSWLCKNNPEIYAKNEAEKFKEAKAKVETSDVIDLSSDEDEVVVTHRPIFRRRNIIKRLHTGQTFSNFQNPQLLIRTNEVEILPIQNVCLNEKENQIEHDDIPSPDTPDLPEGIAGVTIPAEDSNFENSSPEHHIWPDTEISDPLGNDVPLNGEGETENTTSTKDTTPKDQINNADQNENSGEMTLSQREEVKSSSNTDLAEKMDVTEPNVNGTNKTNDSEITENILILNAKSSDLIEVSHEAESGNIAVDCNGDKTLEAQENSDLLQLQSKDTVTDADELINNSTSTEVDENNPSSATNDKSNNPENIPVEINSDPPENSEENDNSADNSSSFIIEKVTSLNNQHDERMDVDSRDLTEENAERENSDENWESLAQDDDDDDSQDVEPDIILCDSLTSVVTHIKEEPLSANEAEEEEEEEEEDGEDPLNFHSVLLKRESDDFVDESEDVKPNVQLLNEAMENQYTPKRLKNGKVHCEPCRVSFSNDVYYERHTKSLRHRMNFKLYRLGKGPTKARGKALINVAMGNYGNIARGNGPYCCPQCPSRFKHMRNLHTHKKKHLLEVRVSSRKPPSETASQSSDFEITNVETNSKVREDLKCELCLRSFMSMPALVSHKRFCGVSEKQQCTHCGQSFTTQSLFVKHRKDCLKDYRRSIFTEQRYREEELKSRMTPPSQTTPKPSSPVPVTVPLDGSVLACTLCNLTFQTSTELINHMQQNHMDFGKIKNDPPPELPDFAKPNHFSRTRDSRLHYCKYCLRSFPTLGALSSHTGYHARKSAYCCKFCRQTFKDKIGFRQHIKVHIADPNLNKNVCWMCYTPFASQRELINHKAVHANVKLKIFSCSICGNSYNSKELLSKHRRASHMMPLINPEDDLEMVPDSETGYHKMIDEDNKLFKCKICKKRFTTSGNLKRHSLKHKPGFVGHLGNFHSDYSVQHRCNWCFKGFKTQTGLLNHKPFCSRFRKTGLPHTNNVHTGAIKCKDCKRWFASQNSIYKHKLMKRCRPIQQPREEETVVPIKAQNCPNCDQQFLSEESLLRHKQNCKPSIERLTCDCGEVFGSVELKQNHAETCASNCTCKNCNMKFNSPEELESHQSICQLQSQNHTPAPTPPPFQSKTSSYGPESRLPTVECAKCKKKFVYSKCLQIHEDKCLYDRWPCTNCLEIFPTETALATHKSHKSCQSPRLNRSSSITSLGDGPTFKCEFCPERFVSANELKEHTATCENRLSGIEPEGGSGERPFKCDQCDKTFLWKVNVQRHRKLAHKHLYQSDTESTPVRKNPEREASTYRCKLCPDIIFHKQQGLLEHQRIHESQEKETTEADPDESGVLLTCELCDKKLPEALYPLHMDEHMNDDFEESQEIEVPPVECELGGSYSCDICGKEFSTPQSRKSHRASHWRHYTTGYVPTLEPSFKRKYKVKHVRCNICNKLLSINSLPKHKMMHRREAAEYYGGEGSQTPQKPAQATSASTSASRSSTPSPMVDLSYNQEEENEETSTSIFPCPKCDKTFKLRKLLLEHMKNHMDESPDPEGFSSAPGTVDQYPYKCVYCDLSWKYKSVYERHLTSKKHLEIQKQLSGII